VLSRNPAHRIVAAEKKEEKGKKLRGVHTRRIYFSQPKVEENDHRRYSYNLDRRRRNRRDSAGTQICFCDDICNPRKTVLFAPFGSVGFDDRVISQRFLSRIAE